MDRKYFGDSIFAGKFEPKVVICCKGTSSVVIESMRFHVRAECGLRIGREGETPALNVLETVVHGDCECRAGEREKDGGWAHDFRLFGDFSRYTVNYLS